MVFHHTGVDIVDATFPWLIAERGGALVFPNSILEEYVPIHNVVLTLY